MAYGGQQIIGPVIVKFFVQRIIADENNLTNSLSMPAPKHLALEVARQIGNE